MKNKKLNNLFAFGKKAALLAIFATLPFSAINANSEQISEPKVEQTEQTNKKQHRDTRGLWVFTWLMLSFCIPWWTYMIVDSRRHPEKWRGLERGI